MMKMILGRVDVGLSSDFLEAACLQGPKLTALLVGLAHNMVHCTTFFYSVFQNDITFSVQLFLCCGSFP